MQVQMIKHLKTRTIHSNIYINLIVSFAIFFTCAYAFLMLIASKNVLIFIFNEQHQTQRSWVCGCELGIDVKCSVKYWIFTCPAKEATHDVFCLKYIQDVMTCKCFRIILVSFCLLIGLRMGGLILWKLFACLQQRQCVLLPFVFIMHAFGEECFIKMFLFLLDLKSVFEDSAVFFLRHSFTRDHCLLFFLLSAYSYHRCLTETESGAL